MSCHVFVSTSSCCVMSCVCVNIKLLCHVVCLCLHQAALLCHVFVSNQAALSCHVFVSTSSCCVMSCVCVNIKLLCHVVFVFGSSGCVMCLCLHQAVMSCVCVCFQLLCHVFEQNAMELIFYYIDLSRNRDVRLAFEAHKVSENAQAQWLNASRRS